MRVFLQEKRLGDCVTTCNQRTFVNSKAPVEKPGDSRSGGVTFTDPGSRAGERLGIEESTEEVREVDRGNAQDGAEERLREPAEKVFHGVSPRCRRWVAERVARVAVEERFQVRKDDHGGRR